MKKCETKNIVFVYCVISVYLFGIQIKVFLKKVINWDCLQIFRTFNNLRLIFQQFDSY